MAASAMIVNYSLMDITADSPSPSYSLFKNSNEPPLQDVRSGLLVSEKTVELDILRRRLLVLWLFKVADFFVRPSKQSRSTADGLGNI